MNLQDLPEVRIAMPADEADIMAMCRRLWRENGMFTLSEKKVRDCLHRCFNRQGTIVGVVGAPGAIEASICMAISDFYYTDDWHLAELWNYVEPEHRRSHNAAALIEFGKDCARKMKCPFFTGIITNRQMAGKVRLYQQLLGRPVGAFFIYNGNWKTDPIDDYAELRGRLKTYADKCATAPKSVKYAIIQQQVAPLLREAARALAEDNLWRPSKQNSASHAAGSP